MADTDQQAEIGAGDVDLEFDGKPLKLRPTLEACIRLNNLHKSLRLTQQRVEAFDFDTICEVIAAGVPANPTQMKNLVVPGVYRTGMINLIAPCIEFIGVVMNGGKPLPDIAEVETDDGPLDLTASPSGNSTDNS